jgi:hypothetical protein
MRRTRGGLRCLLAACLALASSPAIALDFDARLKAFATLNELPDDDIQRAETGNPAYDGNLDLRLLFRDQLGPWELIADHTTIGLAGDTYEFNNARARGAVDQTPTDDDRRALDLTWTLQREDDYRLYHRFDRLALRYQTATLRVTVGREAVSWGSGKAFNPMDVFAPFAPTTVDRDYKAGDDMVVVEKLLDSGGDLQGLAVFRRGESGDRGSEENSVGAKWRTFLGDQELELAVGKHYEDHIAAVSYRLPIGGALLQTDWIATDLDAEGEVKVSGVVNVDYSFGLDDRTAYVFAEYYRNGFGRNNSPVDLLQLPEYLTARVQRGEVFSLMKDYMAFGGFYQWHALLTQGATLLWNMHDDSTLLQTNLAYEPSDNQRLEAGLTVTTGGRGDEYGRIEVVNGLTTGGGSRLFLRWVYFW